MLRNWFNTQKQDEDDLYDSDNDERIINLDKLFENDQMTIVKMTAGEFINIPCWAYNRPLDKSRVVELKNAIITRGTIYGIFTLVSQNNQLYIIDGQHRHQALMKAIEKDCCHTDIPIICVIYDVVEDSEIIDLFKKVNNTKPLDPKETPDAVIMFAIKELGKLYSNAIHFDKNKTVYPYILAKELKDKLSTIKFNNISSQELYKKIKQINNKYSRMPIKNIPNIRTNITIGAVNKARQSGFYLGLDEKWSWIDELEIELNS
jgi:hypothetical protein